MSTASQRASVTVLVAAAVTDGARLASACAVIGFSERTFQRWSLDDEGIDGRSLRHEPPVHKLSSAERAELLVVANSAEFGHLPPSQIVPRLADQDRYIASESTFYRVLRAAGQLAHRRAERGSQKRAKPRALAATEPNQIYSWDITYLPTRVLGLYFYLYLFIDVFSRKIVAWQVYAEESGDHAGQIVQDLCWRECIVPGRVTLHSDNGGPMKGATMLATLQALGVMASLSRPSVSNDNPYSESLFKTLKYRPAYPLAPFADLATARSWVTTLVQWYNHDHRHSAIRFVTPAQRHAGLDAALLAKRSDLYEGARAKNPLRWKRQTRNWRRVAVVHLNPENADKTENSESDNQIEERTAVKPQMRQVA
jgi:putative transposase